MDQWAKANFGTQPMSGIMCAGGGTVCAERHSLIELNGDTKEIRAHFFLSCKGPKCIYLPTFFCTGGGAVCAERHKSP